MTLEVLISCMRQIDHSIVKRSNIQSNAVLVNQCGRESLEEFDFISKIEESCHVKFICTTERGLSKSRNMAITNATADVCLICDDDEILYDDYSDLIIRAFKENPDADVLAFQIKDAGKTYPKSKKRIGYLGALKLASWQLAFKRKSIVDKNIKFDITLGSGVSKAGGEENKFIYDCLKNKLKVVFVPVTIGRMIEGESQWFFGANKEFFYDRGIMTRKLMGKGFASAYAVYYLIFKYHWYRKDCSFFDATKAILMGIFNIKRKRPKITCSDKSDY